jgi:hypothetical protein
MTSILKADLQPAFDALIVVLHREKDPVRQQQLIELLTARHCHRVGEIAAALFVADSINKHVRSIIKQWSELKEVHPNKTN